MRHAALGQQWPVLGLVTPNQNDQKFHFKCVRLDLAQHLSAQLPATWMRDMSILYTANVTGSNPSVSQCKQNFHRWKFWILIQHLLSLWEAQKGQAFIRPSATLPASPSTSNLPSSSRSYDLRLAMLRRKSPGKSKISMDRASGNECYSRLVQLMRITESLLKCEWHPWNTKAEQSMLYLLLPTLFNAV